MELSHLLKRSLEKLENNFEPVHIYQLEDTQNGNLQF